MDPKTYLDVYVLVMAFATGWTTDRCRQMSAQLIEVGMFPGANHLFDECPDWENHFAVLIMTKSAEIRAWAAQFDKG